MKEFFSTGKLLKQLNANALMLLLKGENPQTMREYRPLACCNVLLKIITKILSNRLRPILEKVVSPVQGAVVEGRLSNHNVFLCQELLSKYGRKGVSPRCTLKIDIQKAYDMLCWDFLQAVMEGLRFPAQFISWVLTCVTTVHFSVVLNGELEGYFPAKRLLRQGDPLSSFLLVLAMEYLNRMLACLTDKADFRFHFKCQRISLTHLCFANDLMVFCRGDVGAACCVTETIKRFGETSGLFMNATKSVIYLGGMNDESKQGLL